MTQRFAIVVFGVIAVASAAEAVPPALLPTQQRVQPVGKEVDLGLFPTGIALSSDGRLVLATNNGFLYQSLTVVDTTTLTTVDRRIGALGSNVLFVGVALSPDGRTGYASGHTDAGQDVVHTATLAPGPTLTLGTPIIFPRGSFPAGMAMAPDGKQLYVAENLGNSWRSSIPRPRASPPRLRSAGNRGASPCTRRCRRCTSPIASTGRSPSSTRKR